MKYKESKFKFERPYLLALDFKVNMDLSPDVDMETNVKFNLEQSVSKNNREANVVFHIDINQMSSEFKENQYFKMFLTLGCMFKWDSDLKEEIIENLLDINAPALLLSYARPIIANITQQSGLPTYNIPFMNFTRNE